jgi:endonuclease/exonuclease/phosphatase family metal-dependent hydrolase
LTKYYFYGSISFMSQVEAPQLSMMEWNIKAGGFDTHDPTLTVPGREAGIQAVIANFHEATTKDASAVSLCDVYRWDVAYGGNQDIADHLDYPYARFVPIDDDRMRGTDEEGMGTIFATDQAVHSSQPIDLDTRQGQRTILDIGEDGLQVASVYLDHSSEDNRLKQVRALVAGLEKGTPTVITGDFNALRPNMSGASFNIKARDLAVRALVSMVPKRASLNVALKGVNFRQIGEVIKDLNSRQTIPLLESLGYKDADATKKRPTAPAMLPILGTDYVFHNDRVTVDNLTVLPDRRQSDHRPLTFDVTIS